MGLRKQILPGRHRIALIQVLTCLAVVGGHLRSEAGLVSLVGPYWGTLPATPLWTNAEPAFRAPPNWYVTGEPLDVAIEGTGYFVLRDPESPALPPRLTRSGSFGIDAQGRLISNSGLRLQGIGPDGTSTIDLTITIGQSVNGATLSSIKIQHDGTLVSVYFDDTSRVAGRIALWQPEPHTRLRRWSDDDYTDPNLPVDWRARLVVPDGIACRLHSRFVQSPDPELQVVDYQRDRLLDTPSFPMRVGLEFCVTLEGPGFLVVRDPRTGTRYLTRCGLMHQDWEGWLVTVPEGFRVQGWTNRALTLSGDLHIDASDRPADAEDGVLRYAYLQSDGDLAVFLSNGVQFTRAKLWLTRIPDPALLREIRHGLYAMPEDGELASLDEAITDSTTALAAASLDPRFLNAERQQWLHRRYRFQQQPVSRTGVDSHLAIAGSGYFRLRDPKTGQQILTRSGLFLWSNDGYLEGLHGWRVQGRSLAGSSDHAVIDVRTHHGEKPTASDHYQIGGSGEVGYSQSDGTQRTVAGILLAHVPDPMVLRELEPRHYLIPDNDVDPSYSFDGAPGERGLGIMMAGALEEIWQEEFWQVRDLPNAGRLLQLRGLAGRRARIQISEDMRSWSDWMSVDESGQIRGGWIDVLDPASRAVCLTDMVLDAEKPRGAGRFYRLVVETNSWPWIGWW